MGVPRTRRSSVQVWTLLFLLSTLLHLPVSFRDPTVVTCRMACAGTDHCCCKPGKADERHRKLRRALGPLVLARINPSSCPSDCAALAPVRRAGQEGITLHPERPDRPDRALSQQPPASTPHTACLLTGRDARAPPPTDAQIV
jgi:hypothetical protein